MSEIEALELHAIIGFAGTLKLFNSRLLSRYTAMTGLARM